MADNPRKREPSFHNQQNSEVILRRVLSALGPYREDLILIGGWVPYVYQRFGGFPEWRVEIARTVELDVVIPSPLATAQRLPLAEILNEAGFTPISGDKGAVWTREGVDEEMIEFFTAHKGTARQVGKPLQIPGQIALAAISLTHLALLTDETRTIAIGTYMRNALTVRVPTLGGYVLNKALTFMERLSTSKDGVSKAAKDIAYLRDVMAGGENVRAQVRSDIKVLVKRAKPRESLVRTARDRLHQLTAGASSVLDAAVSQVAVQHRFSSDRAARADLLGNIETLSTLITDTPRKRGRESGR